MDSYHWREGNLCNACDFLIKRVTYWLNKVDLGLEEVPHYNRPDLVLAYAQSGCHLCSIMIGTIFLADGTSPRQAEQWLLSGDAVRRYQPFVRIRASRPVQGSDQVTRMGGPPEAALDLSFGVPSVDAAYVISRNKPLDGRTAMSDRVATKYKGHPGRPTCNSTGGWEALRLASWWLRICREEHPECQKSQESMCLLKSNQKSLHEKVEVRELPRTIRGAVTVTRILGYQFLWVDSLCIIQDSKEDWASEAGKMGSIYQHAVLTLAALHASGNDEGLFISRNPLCARSLPIPGTYFEVSNTAFHFIWEYDGQKAPLQTRAWVIQERVSARRTLFFGATGIYWECVRC